MDITKKKRKKVKSKRGKTVPTLNNSKICAVADAGRKWEYDLKTFRSFLKGEVGFCLGIVAKHHQDGCFPESDSRREPKVGTLISHERGGACFGKTTS